MDRPAEVVEAGIPVGAALLAEELLAADLPVVELLVEEAAGPSEVLLEVVRLEAAEDPLHRDRVPPDVPAAECRPTTHTATTRPGRIPTIKPA